VLLWACRVTLAVIAHVDGAEISVFDAPGFKPLMVAQSANVALAALPVVVKVFGE
jgi:hypothetical protein